MGLQLGGSEGAAGEDEEGGSYRRAHVHSWEYPKPSMLITMSFQIRHLAKGFRSFSRKHGCIAMGALEGSSDTDLREMSPRVSTSLPNHLSRV